MHALLAAANGVTKTNDGDVIQPSSWMSQRECLKYFPVAPNDYAISRMWKTSLAHIIIGIYPYLGEFGAFGHGGGGSSRIGRKTKPQTKAIAERTVWRICNHTDRIMAPRSLPYTTHLALHRVNRVVRWRFHRKYSGMDVPVLILAPAPRIAAASATPSRFSLALPWVSSECNNNNGDDPDMRGRRSMLPADCDWEAWAVFVIEHELARLAHGFSSAHDPRILIVFGPPSAAGAAAAAAADTYMEKAGKVLKRTLDDHYVHNSNGEYVFLRYTFLHTTTSGAAGQWRRDRLHKNILWPLRKWKELIDENGAMWATLRDQVPIAKPPRPTDVFWSIQLQQNSGIVINPMDYVPMSVIRGPHRKNLCILWECKNNSGSTGNRNAECSCTVSFSIPGMPSHDRDVAPFSSAMGQAFWPLQGTPQPCKIALRMPYVPTSTGSGAVLLTVRLVLDTASCSGDQPPATRGKCRVKTCEHGGPFGCW